MAHTTYDEAEQAAELADLVAQTLEADGYTSVTQVGNVIEIRGADDTTVFELVVRAKRTN